MAKKAIKSLIIVIVILIMVYIGFKLFYLSLLNGVDNQEAWINNLTNYTEPLTINKKPDNNLGYITFQNMKVANYFEEFEKHPSNEDSDVIHSYVLRTDENSYKAAFIINIYPTFVSQFRYIYDHGSDIYSETKVHNFMNKINTVSLLEKHNVTNDLEFFSLIIDNNKKNVNIFSSFRKMKEFGALKQFAAFMTSEIDSVTLINGDYSGYILNTRNNKIRELRIIEGDTAYIMTFINQEENYFTDDLIKEIVGTLETEKDLDTITLKPEESVDIKLGAKEYTLKLLRIKKDPPCAYTGFIPNNCVRKGEYDVAFTVNGIEFWLDSNLNATAELISTDFYTDYVIYYVPEYNEKSATFYIKQEANYEKETHLIIGNYLVYVDKNNKVIDINTFSQEDQTWGKKYAGKSLSQITKLINSGIDLKEN